MKLKAKQSTFLTMNFLALENIKLDNNKIVATIIVFVAFMVLRSILAATLNRWSFSSNDERRRWMINLKNFLFLVFVLGLLFVWGSELRSLVLSLVAVAAALVIATKEIILCLMGGILKASTKLFVVGDRIQVRALRGEVIDHNFLVTTLFEIGPGEKSNQFTGRTLKVPNSLFLNESVVVEPSGQHYCLTVFRVPLLAPKNLKTVEQILLDSAVTVGKPYYQEARAYLQDICKNEGVNTPYLEPRVLYEVKDKDTVEFHIRMLVSFSQKSAIEKQLLDLFFQTYEPIIDQQRKSQDSLSND